VKYNKISKSKMMTVTTRATNEEAFTHLMVTIFGWTKDITEANEALAL